MSLGRGRPSFSHVFFVDDLVLFGEASLENAATMKNIHGQFCAYSSHKMNSGKSKVYFSANTKATVWRMLGNVLGFQEVFTKEPLRACSSFLLIKYKGN